MGDLDHPESFRWDEAKTGIRGGAYYAVAQTKAGRLVVLTARSQGDNFASLLSHDDFDAFKMAQDDNRSDLYPMR